MSDSRDAMLSLLEKHKQIIRQRTVDPATLSSKSSPYSVDLSSSPRGDGPKGASQRPSSPSSNILHARENLRAFLEHHYRVLCAFAEDGSRLEMELTTDLSPDDRRALHALAEACNLAHHSRELAGPRRRVLTLKKDVLFFKNRQGYRGVDLAGLAARIGGRESKFALRRVRAGDRAAGAVGGYDDDEVPARIARFRRFTDEYRHAVEVGYGREEAPAMADAAARLEEILRRPAPEEAPAVGPEAAPRLPVKGAPAKVFLVEHCRGCGARGAVEGADEGWCCEKYCARCARRTIWRLTEAEAEEEDPTPPQRRRHDALESGEVLSDDDRAASKRPRVVKESIERDSQASEEPERRVEEIHVEEPDAITVEDVVDMACANDFAAEDTNWLRRFASVNAVHLSQCVFFCIKYEDMLDIFSSFEHTLRGEEKRLQRDQASIAASEGGHGSDADSRADIDAPSTAGGCVYVVIRENPMENFKATDLIQKMCAASFSFPPNSAPSSAGNAAENERDCVEAALQHIGLAFLNASVYGSATTAVCQLRPCIPSVWSKDTSPFLSLNMENLLSMQQEYGKACFYLASSLEDAVRFVIQEGESAP